MNLHSHVCIPLAAGNQVLGLLNVGWHAPYPYTKAEQALLSAIGQQVGLALRNAQLYQTARQVDPLRVLNKLDQALSTTLDPDAVSEIALKQIAAAVDAPMGALFATLPRTANFSSLPPQTSPPIKEAPPQKSAVKPQYQRVFILGWGWIAVASSQKDAVRSRAFLHRCSGSVEPLPLSGDELAALTDNQGPDLAERWGQHGVLLPIQHAGALIAMLALGGRPGTRPFTEAELLLAQTAIARTAQALQNARQHQAVQAAEARYRDLYHSVPVGLYRTTPEGRFLAANRAMMQISGSPNAESGSPNAESMLEANAIDWYVDAVDRQWWQSLMEREEGVRGFEVQFFRQDGSQVWVENHAHTVRDENGQVVYYEGSLIDISARRQAEDMARAQHTLALELSAAPSLDATLRLCVAAALRNPGLDAGGIYLVDAASGDITLAFPQGLSPAFVAASAHYAAEAPAARLVMAGEPIYSKYQEFDVPMGDVQRREGLRATAVLPIRHAGQVIACLNVASRSLDALPPMVRAALETNVAQIGSFVARARAEDALRASERKLKQAEWLARLGHWERDLRTNTLTWSDEVYRILGLEAQAFDATRAVFLDVIHPEDREFVTAVDTTSVANKTPYDIGYRLLLADGTLKFVREICRTKYDAAGPLRSLGTVQDVTAQALAEQELRLHREHLEELVAARTAELAQANAALRESESKLDGILSAMHDLVFAFDTEGRFIFVHTPSVKFLYAPPATFIGKKPQDVMPPDVGALFGTAFEKIRCGQIAEYDYPLAIDTEDEWFSAKLSPLFVADEFAGAVAVVRNITVRKRAEEEIQRLYEQTQRDAETKATLLQEVNHRVGNNLAALIGILDLEQDRAVIDASTYQAVMGDLTNRIRGLATVHRMLSATEWSPPFLSEVAEQVIKSALQALPRDKRVSVEVLPFPLRVSPKEASNLALVLNELTTNSIKYAWPDRQNGRISVCIEQQENMIMLEFRNDGEDYPLDVLTLERHSIGWELIQIVVEGMRGEVSLRNDGGAVTVIRYPLFAKEFP